MFQSYGEIQLWLTTCFDINLSCLTVYQLVRYKLKSKLKSKLKVPPPKHIKHTGRTSIKLIEVFINIE